MRVQRSVAGSLSWCLLVSDFEGVNLLVPHIRAKPAHLPLLFGRPELLCVLTRFGKLARIYRYHRPHRPFSIGQRLLPIVDLPSNAGRPMSGQGGRFTYLGNGIPCRMKYRTAQAIIPLSPSQEGHFSPGGYRELCWSAFSGYLAKLHIVKCS